MTVTKGTGFGARRGLMMALVALLLVTACARPPVPADGHDPFEATNRIRFEGNLALSRAILGDSAEAPARDGPAPLRRMVRNFGANLGAPATVANDLLQLRPDRAVGNTLRFVVNSTIGLAGLFDPATAIGLPGRHSDFGETLHRWGMGEGAYVVLPVLGPSTERDMLGMVVDAVIDPWGFVATRHEARAVTAARWAGRVAEMGEYADLLDANVIRTADPYAQARLLFLQTRRYHLGIETEDDFIDPYAFLD